MSRAGDQSRLSLETCEAVFRWAATGHPLPSEARAEIRAYARSVGAPDPQSLMSGHYLSVVNERHEWEQRLDRHSKQAVDILRRLRDVLASGKQPEEDDQLQRELGRWFRLDEDIVADAKARGKRVRLERVK